MRRTSDVTEESPLLNNDRHQPDGSVQETGEDVSAHHDIEQHDDAIPLVREASTRELLVVMGAIWLGVFFAALGRSINIRNSLFTRAK